MGFFDFIRKKQEVPHPSEERQKAEIPFREIGAWFRGNFNEDVQGSREKAREICSETVSSFRETSKNLIRLEKARFMEGNKTYAAVNMSKDTFVKKARVIIRGLDRVPDTDYPSLSEFHAKARGALSSLNSISLKQAVFLSNYFREEGTPLIESIKSIQQSLDSFDRFLLDEGKVLFLENEISNASREYSGLVERKGIAEEAVRKKEDDMNALKQSVVEKRDMIRKIEGSAEYRGFVNAQEEEASLLENMESLEAEINSELSGLARPLKKIRHLSEKGRPEAAFTDLPENPFKEIILAGSEALLVRAIEGIKEAHSDGRIQLKGAELSRAENLKQFIESALPGKREEYLQMQKDLEKCRSAKERNAGAFSRKAEVEEDIKRKEDTMEKAAQEMVRLQKELSAISEETKRKAEELGAAISKNSVYDASLIYN